MVASMAKRMNPNGIKKIQQNLKGANSVKVGFFETSRYPDGTPVAYVAAINEFGYPEGNIPSRSFMRSTTQAKQGSWREKVIAPFAKKILNGAATVTHLAERLGMVASTDMQKKISEITTPALAESTIEARKARFTSKSPKKKLPKTIEKPLVETGQMLGALTYVVTDKD